MLHQAKNADTHRPLCGSAGCEKHTITKQRDQSSPENDERMDMDPVTHNCTELLHSKILDGNHTKEVIQRDQRKQQTYYKTGRDLDP